MHRRRFSPYSHISEIAESRKELLALVIGAVFLGVLLSMAASALYDILVLNQPIWASRLVTLLTVFILSVLLILGIAWALHSLRDSATVRMEVAIPYYQEGGRIIRIAPQHSYRPRYGPAIMGKWRFAAACERSGPAARQLLEEWQSARQSHENFADFMAKWHKELVDCLILHALRDYGNDSLSPKANYRMWQSPLPSRETNMENLPALLRENVFVNALAERSQGWKLLLPKGVALEVKEVRVDWPGEKMWKLHRKGYGEIEIRCLRHFWEVGYSRKVGKALGEGLTRGQRRSLSVLGSRIEAKFKASFGLPFLRRANDFDEWSAGLLAYLEEELDWGYFDRSRADRLVIDLRWILGDLPEGTSIWNKLEVIDGVLKELHQNNGTEVTSPDDEVQYGKLRQEGEGV